MPKLRIGGFTPLSTIDWPGKLAAVVFCQGCPWRCGYCHNPDLLPFHPDKPGPWEWRRVRDFLNKRRKLLDAVIFSGGEPTFQADLHVAMAEVKRLGFAVGLHTGGANPQGLEKVLPWLDWVGLDIKAGFADYEKITRVADSGAKAEASLALLLAGNIPFECRTTVHADLLSSQDILNLGRTLADLGVRRYALQEFRSLSCADPGLAKIRQPWSLEEVSEPLQALFPNFSLRLL